MNHEVLTNSVKRTNNLISKKLLILFTFSFCLSAAFSQSKWSPRASMPDSTRDGAIGFAIGNYGYVGLGEAPDKSIVPKPDYKDFWRFDPSKNKWTQMAKFPGKARGFAATFVIGSYGYVVTGNDSDLITCTNECWQYNSITNKWTSKAVFPGHIRTYAVGFAIGKKGYVGLGSQADYNSYKDFWAYDTTTNSWTQIASFGSIPRIAANGFAVKGNGYVCFGEDSTYTFHRDMWEYDTGTNSWTQKNSCPGVSDYCAGGFVLGNNFYVGTGEDSAAKMLNNFWQYNTISNAWQVQANFLGKARGCCSAFSIEDTGYMGLGVYLDTSAFQYFNDLYRFSPDSTLGINSLENATLGISVFPNPFINSCTILLPEEVVLYHPAFELYDIEGRKHNFEILQAGKICTLSRNNLPTGVYIFSVHFNNQTINKKLIINN